MASLIGAPVVVSSSEHKGVVGCVVGEATKGLCTVILGSPHYKTVYLRRTHLRVMLLEATEGNEMPFAVEEGSFNAFAGLPIDALRRVVFGACDHAALRILREAFFARSSNWSLGEATEMMRVAWEADVRRKLVGKTAMHGGVASAVWLCIRSRQLQDVERGGYEGCDIPMHHAANGGHDNATMVLMQFAFSSDDPSVLVVLYQWTPDWRIRKAFIRRGPDGRGANEESVAHYVSASGLKVSAGMSPAAEESDEFAEDYTYEMAERHPRGCPNCVRWLRKRNETARAVFKARRAANLEKKRAYEASQQEAGRERAQAAFEAARECHDAREAAARAEAVASEQERVRRIAIERERRRQQANTMQPGATLPGPSHREPQCRQQALREVGMEEKVARQQWKEERANRAACAEEKQRSAHELALARKLEDTALREREQRARRAMAAEEAAHVTPSPPTLADYIAVACGHKE